MSKLPIVSGKGLVKKKPIVIKIGTSSLTARKCGEGINYEVVNRLACTVADIQKKKHRKVIIVSSGAMGSGLAKLKITKPQDQTTSFKQALTAVGQIQLMNAYDSVFKNYGYHVGQVLVTHQGLDDEERCKTLRNTIKKLFELNVIPVFNENDTVAASEIEFGDNDRLSARIAVLAKAEILFILTDCEGLYSEDPYKNPNANLLHTVKKITKKIKTIARDSSTHVGLGGMKSKIMAAEICLKHGIAMHILSNEKVNTIPNLIDNLHTNVENTVGTKFLA